jgi:hypothetical protein
VRLVLDSATDQSSPPRMALLRRPRPAHVAETHLPQDFQMRFYPVEFSPLSGGLGYVIEKQFD